jgi:hypothetical protein
MIVNRGTGVYRYFVSQIRRLPSWIARKCRLAIQGNLYDGMVAGAAPHHQRSRVRRCRHSVTFEAAVTSCRFGPHSIFDNVRAGRMYERGRTRAGRVPVDRGPVHSARSADTDSRSPTKTMKSERLSHSARPTSPRPARRFRGGFHRTGLFPPVPDAVGA